MAVVPLKVRRHAAARRYILRVIEPGVVSLTIPPGGRVSESLAFLEQKKDWLGEQFARVQASHAGRAWREGSRIMIAGEWHKILIRPRSGGHRISLGPWNILCGQGVDIRQAVERRMRRQARKELPLRIHEIAKQTGLPPNRITIRGQKTRWGSCSSNRSVSFNWRLVQLPPWVCDYIIFHELAHLDHLNHTEAFWARLAGLFPRTEEAEKWLKAHEGRLALPPE